MEESMVGHDIYLRHTDKRGSSYIAHHRAWDTMLFLDHEHKNAIKEGGSVSVVSDAQYREARGYK